MIWDNNPFIENAKKNLINWEKGYDLSGADAVTLEKFGAYASLVLKPNVVRYDTSIIETLVKKDIVLTESHEIIIGDNSYKLGSLTSSEIRTLIRNEKNARLISTISHNLVEFLESLSFKDYERELSFLITNRFDQMIIDKKLSDEIDLDFVNQIYSTTHHSIDQIKFVFFTMAQNPNLKNEALFKVLYKYLSNLKLDELYFYLRQS